VPGHDTIAILLHGSTLFVVRKPAVRRESAPERSVFEWECSECGVWRVGLAREIALERMNEDSRRGLATRVRTSQQRAKAVMV
jgi:hypothetical protein